MKSMGCVQGRSQLEDNPGVFRVINVDTSGRNLRPGHLEVTDTQLVFHQKGGRVVIRWPLTCLRRYGFDSEVFSFECGRRCATGSGVYGFKCRRAEALFTMLQESINHPPPSNTIDPITLVPPAPATPAPNGALPVDEAGYLEPISVNARRPSVSVRRNNNNNGTVSPGGYVSIHESSHEWPSNIPRCCSFGTCMATPTSANHHYVNNDVIEQEVFINQYVNQSVVVANEPQACHGCTPTRNCDQENTYVNSSVVTLSPDRLGRCCACANCNTADVNTNYAKLDDLLKQEQSTKLQHFYVNVKPDLTQPGSSDRTSPDDLSSRKTSVISASLSSSNVCSPIDASKEQQIEVNYAELDLDANESVQTVSASASNPNSLHSLASSPAKSPEGYAQIDFDKTVALSNSANPYPSFNDDSMRKTRHNAVIPYANAST